MTSNLMMEVSIKPTLPRLCLWFLLMKIGWEKLAWKVIKFDIH